MFTGAYTALITPFLPSGEIDWKSFEELIEWNLQEGINGFVLCGTTAETPTLSHDEKLAVIRKGVDVIAKRVPVIAGTGSNCTRTSIELTREAKACGVSAALVVNPYYNKPTQEGLYQHFVAVARDGGLPIILYNIPGRTNVDLAPETFARLAKHPEFIGVKEASGSSGKLMDILEACGDRIPLIAGDDNITYLVMACGGVGVISASANVMPNEMSAIPRLCGEGKWAEARALQVEILPKIRALFLETNPAPVKAALMKLGRIQSDALRLPLVPVREQTRRAIDDLFS